MGQGATATFPPIMRIPSVLLAAALAPAALPALELFDFADLRVGASVVGRSAEVTSKSSSTKTTAKESWDKASRINADLVAGTDLVLIGIAYGGGVSFDKRTSNTVTSDTTVGRLQAGPYVDFAIFQLELLPFVGVGTTRLKDEATGSDGKATDLEYGANVNLVAAISHAVVGASVGYLKVDSTASLDNGGTAYDYSVSGGDYTAGAFVGYRF